MKGYLPTWTAIVVLVLSSSASGEQESGSYLLDPSTIELAESLRIVPLQENLWLVWSTDEWNGRTISANGLVLAGSNGVLVVDTPWTDEQTALLLDWIDRELDPQVLRVVVTHAHKDRSGGIAEVHRRGIATIGYAGTVALAADQGYEPPESTFSDSLELDVGHETVTMYYPGPGHAPDNMVVWLAGRRLLYGGCLIKNLASTGLGYTGDADLAAWPVSLARLEELFPDASAVIPGHGEAGGPELIDHTRELLDSRQKTSSQ